MPPPASYVRTFLHDELGRNADRKAIFVGEYNLDFPPSLNTRHFLAVAKAFGYSGIWPWSLYNRVDESGNRGIDVNPQFAELESYLSVFPSLTKTNVLTKSAVPETRSSDDTDSALSSVREQILSNVNLRIAELEADDIVSSHRKHASENMEWRQRILQRDLPIFKQHLTQASTEKERALNSLQENEAWVRRAPESDISRARSSEKTSRQWLARAEHQIATAQADITKQEADLLKATAQVRRHSYLTGEASSELAWLRWLKSALVDASPSPDRKPPVTGK
jgi:hypothetical protein